MFRLKRDGTNMHYLAYEPAHLHDLAGVCKQKLGQATHIYTREHKRSCALTAGLTTNNPRRRCTCSVNLPRVQDCSKCVMSGEFTLHT